MWIAKFPMRNDGFSVGKAEAACLDMAAEMGINTPDRKIEIVGGYPILLTRRFDRAKEGPLQHRLAYLSAETVLGADPHSYTTNHSYADIATVGRKLGCERGEEVFRRLLLDVLVGNTDGHLRNHAFLRGLDGHWALSPAYDIVPHPAHRKMVLKVGETHEVSLAEAMNSFPRFGLNKERADVILDKATFVASRWKDFMAARGISEHDIRRLEPAFAAIVAGYTPLRPKPAASSFDVA
jgi:serine/threonine-protein kinase HipA